MLDYKFFLELGPNVVNLFRKHTFDNSKDVDGKKFKPYSTEYGKNKRALKYKRQAEAREFAQTRSPVLTGDLYRDFKLIRTTPKGFSFGTIVWGSKVLALREMGRVIATNKDPFPKHIERFIEREVEEYVEKKLNKLKVKGLRGGKFKLNL